MASRSWRTWAVRSVREARFGIPFARRLGRRLRRLVRAREGVTRAAEEVGRRARQAPKEFKALGKHPESGEDVKILDGRYGPYVTDGTTNASVPKGTQVEAVTMAAAVELLNARAGMGGKKSKIQEGQDREGGCTQEENGAPRKRRRDASVIG